MATQHLSDEDIEELKQSLQESAVSLRIDNISDKLATWGIGLGAVGILVGTLFSWGWPVVIGLALMIWGLWVRSSVNKDRVRRLETQLALHVLGADREDTEVVE